MMAAPLGISPPLFFFLVLLVCVAVHEVFFDLKFGDDGHHQYDEYSNEVPVHEKLQASNGLVLLDPTAATIREQQHKQSDELLPTRPNWKASMDCSIFILDCPMRRHYAPYPFDFWNNNTFPEADSQELEKILQTTASPNKISEKLQNELKQPVDKKEEEKCLKYTRDTPFDQQLDEMLKKLSRAANNRHVAYTMSDVGYAKDMIHDVFAMAHNVVGFPHSFFMVAIDQATLELGCRYGYPIMPSPSSGGLEDRVKFTKFQVSLSLLQRGQDFLFFEMDIWFFRSIIPLLQNQFGDILVSSHQNYPLSSNIGVYAVNANDATREYFQHCLEVSAKVEIHDQKLMQYLATVSRHQEEGKDPLDDHPNVTFEHYVHMELLSPHEIACSEWPRATLETIAIHPLASRPLMGPHGKMQIAKEFGAFYGSNGYYSSEGKYLWLDRFENSYSIVTNFQHQGLGLWHDGRAMKWTIAMMITLAKHTNRILVLPRILADLGRHYLWEILDLQVLENLGVEVRETSFLNNPKLLEFPTVSRTAVGAGRIFWQEDDQVPKFWQIEEKHEMDTFFSLLDRIESNALLVNPQTIHSVWPDRFPTLQLSSVEKAIYDVYSQLKWCKLDCSVNNCHIDWTTEFWDKHRLSATRAEWDCYGKGS